MMTLMHTTVPEIGDPVVPVPVQDPEIQDPSFPVIRKISLVRTKNLEYEVLFQTMENTSLRKSLLLLKIRKKPGNTRIIDWLKYQLK
ncbi:hypothetical protein WN48_10032 [Eufriesea mexicana]|nr:hypothetical protein WN48_10032 [Eufriesea mexicana]